MQLMLVEERFDYEVRYSRSHTRVTIFPRIFLLFLPIAVETKKLLNKFRASLACRGEFHTLCK